MHTAETPLQSPPRESGQRRSIWKSLLLFCFLILTAVFLITGAAAWRQRIQVQQWTAKLEQAGAKVIVAGYGGTGPLSRIPILKELSVRTQIEVFIPNNDVAKRVLPALEGHSELGRIWVHAERVDAGLRQQIEELFPGVSINGYTMAGE